MFKAGAFTQVALLKRWPIQQVWLYTKWTSKRTKSDNTYATHQWKAKQLVLLFVKKKKII